MVYRGSSGETHQIQQIWVVMKSIERDKRIVVVVVVVMVKSIKRKTDASTHAFYFHTLSS